MGEGDLKNEVASFWNKKACGTTATEADKFSRNYFEEIEEYRYSIEPEIFSFAQFTRYHGQKVLEVGVGAGTDFMQWVRAGAKAYGVDLTDEAVQHVKNRLDIYGLHAEEIRVADAENLPYADGTFDLVYSWGVIHHSPDTVKALEEIIRCAKVGGLIKIMIYNRRSLVAYHRYLQFGLLRGKPFRKISDILYHHQESIGTKGYTIGEVKRMVRKYPVKIRNISAKATNYDLLSDKCFLFRIPSYVLACMFGFNHCGWYLTFELEKKR